MKTPFALFHIMVTHMQNVYLDCWN